MKNLSFCSVLFTGVGLLVGQTASAVPGPPGGEGVVIYNPLAKIIQGDQPLFQSSTLGMTSPGNLPSGATPV